LQIQAAAAAAGCPLRKMRKMVLYSNGVINLVSLDIMKTAAMSNDCHDSRLESLPANCDCFSLAQHYLRQ